MQTCVIGLAKQPNEGKCLIGGIYSVPPSSLCEAYYGRGGMTIFWCLLSFCCVSIEDRISVDFVVFLVWDCSRISIQDGFS